MTDRDIQILEEIIQLEGDCLDHRRCDICPLRKQCLPVYLRKRRPSKKKRVQVALDKVVRECLIEETDPPSFKDEE